MKFTEKKLPLLVDSWLNDDVARCVCFCLEGLNRRERDRFHVFGASFTSRNCAVITQSVALRAGPGEKMRKY